MHNNKSVQKKSFNLVMFFVLAVIGASFVGLVVYHYVNKQLKNTVFTSAVSTPYVYTPSYEASVLVDTSTSNLDVAESPIQNSDETRHFSDFSDEKSAITSSEYKISTLKSKLVIEPIIEPLYSLKENLLLSDIFTNNRIVSKSKSNNTSSFANLNNKDNKNQKTQKTLDTLLIEINPKYKKLKKQIEQTNKKPKKVVKKNWYLSKYSKQKQKYLLKTRAQKIKWVKSFFHWYNAPLEKYAAEFVYASECYDIDYRLLPAISIVESSGGKYLFKPYNPFGWGKKGYPSFKHAIWDVSRGMSVYYYRLNRKTPEAIGQIYNPVTPDSWARKVRYLMNQMPKY